MSLDSSAKDGLASLNKASSASTSLIAAAISASLFGIVMGTEAEPVEGIGTAAEVSSVIVLDVDFFSFLRFFLDSASSPFVVDVAGSASALRLVDVTSDIGLTGSGKGIAADSAVYSL